MFLSSDASVSVSDSNGAPWTNTANVYNRYFPPTGKFGAKNSLRGVISDTQGSHLLVSFEGFRSLDEFDRPIRMLVWVRSAITMEGRVLITILLFHYVRDSIMRQRRVTFTWRFDEIAKIGIKSVIAMKLYEWRFYLIFMPLPLSK